MERVMSETECDFCGTDARGAVPVFGREDIDLGYRNAGLIGFGPRICCYCAWRIASVAEEFASQRVLSCKPVDAE
jgi:hypothetical protein